MPSSQSSPFNPHHKSQFSSIWARLKELQESQSRVERSLCEMKQAFQQHDERSHDLLVLPPKKEPELRVSLRGMAPYLQFQDRVPVQTEKTQQQVHEAQNICTPPTQPGMTPFRSSAVSFAQNVGASNKPAVNPFRNSSVTFASRPPDPVAVTLEAIQVRSSGAPSPPIVLFEAHRPAPRTCTKPAATIRPRIVKARKPVNKNWRRSHRTHRLQSALLS